MNHDLNRSVRLLENAVSNPNRGLFTQRASESSFLDLSITMAPHELELLHRTNNFRLEETMPVDKSIVGEFVHNASPWKAAVDGLYLVFFEVLQSQSSSQDALEVIAELARCCSDVLNLTRDLRNTTSHVLEVDEWLEKERDTWRLLFILFQDRLMNHTLGEEASAMQYFGKSEKFCIENLFKRESLIRECQLVIDWLEQAACEKDNPILTFSDATLGWENTLHQLQSADTIAFTSSRPVVSQLDPDVVHHQQKPLHDIDMEDDKILGKRMFNEIRCGKLEEAQKLARQCGHAWKAAVFEGWRLFHNPNIKENSSDPEDNQLRDIEGNTNRAIWKIMALRYVKQDYISQYDKAAIAVFCGSINSLLPVCNTWQDNLWAYMKSMVDIRVESELRDCCSKESGYIPLPEDYWLQRMSLNEVFNRLESSKTKTVREEAKERERLIQKYVILDEIPTLLRELREWSESSKVSTQFLRFVAHLVLFLDQIGQGHQRDCVEKVLEEYIKRLMKMNETRMVAFYLSKLNVNSQVHFYAQHLNTITQHDARKAALEYGEQCGLDVFSITKEIVRIVRDKPEELDITVNLSQKTTELDKIKISAIDWLTFYEAQRTDLLIQSNAIIRRFLALGKLQAAQTTINKVPREAIQELRLELQENNEEVNMVVKEHLSYKAYLEAQEAFNEWFTQMKNKPVEPEALPEGAQFPDKVAHQHRVSQYKAEVERWKLTTTHVAKTTKALLYNVLLFPEGWLVGTENAEQLRKLIIPEVTFLLCSVLYDTEVFEQCVAIADIITSEKYSLYKEFSKDQLQTLLNKIAVAGLALVNNNKDPWGRELKA